MAEYITIPDQYYIGFVERYEDHLIQLGFAVPHGTDSAAKKRMTTVDNWRDEKIEPKVFDNVLMEGFQVFRQKYRSYWGGANVVWRIIDPRGFQLEIESGNMENIIDCTVIDKGMIKGKCVWGRSGSKNVLLPEASEPYQNAMQNTKVKNSVGVKISSVVPGSLITLKNNEQIVYLGKYYTFITEVKNDEKTVVSCDKQYHCYTTVDDGKLVQSISIVADLKVSSVDGVACTPEKAKEHALTMTCIFSSFNYKKTAHKLYDRKFQPNIELVKVNGGVTEAFTNEPNKFNYAVIETLGKKYLMSGYTKYSRIAINEFINGDDWYAVFDKSGLTAYIDNFSRSHAPTKYYHTNDYRGWNYSTDETFRLVSNDPNVVWYKVYFTDENGNKLFELYADRMR